VGLNTDETLLKAGMLSPRASVPPPPVPTSPIDARPPPLPGVARPPPIPSVTRPIPVARLSAPPPPSIPPVTATVSLRSPLPMSPALRGPVPSSPLAPLRFRAQAAHDLLREPTPDTPVPFGKFQLLRRIGAGGMGEVFLAREVGPHGPRACVVKKVLPNLVENRAFVGRFLDESKVVVRLKHPNIARVYAMGEVSGEYYLAMEYVQGKTVSRFAKRLRDKGEQLPMGLVLLLAEKICAGLQYAHDAKDDQGASLALVHRDLSPANVCVSYRGDVKIIDFGAAQSTLKEEQTAPRVVIGNLTYMAPEQARKQPVDGRADVYSCGVLMWELLAWNPLPQKGDPIERWRKAANPSWEPPSTHNKAVPREVDAIILKALRKDPAERYVSAGEMQRVLHAARTRFAPDSSERDLSALLSRMFAKEKAAEDLVIAEAVQGKSSQEVTDKTRRALVPPTALAFEHTAVVAPADYAPPQDDVTDPGGAPGVNPRDTTKVAPEVTGPIPGATIDQTNPVGVTAAEPHINPTRTGFGVTLSTANEPSLAPDLLREIEATGDESPSDREFEAQHPDHDTRPFVAPRTHPLLLGAGVFLAACAAGFAAVWFLAQSQ
jgi:eukaryotic-like serine/threonine-protein kinase